MEFTLQTDLATLPQAIEFNFDALKKELSAQLERYKNLVVAEETLKEARGDRAALNHLLESVNAARLSVKKTYMAPFDAFEKRVKQLVAIIEEPAGAIDKQIKAFEERERQEKYRAIEDFYKANIGALMDLVPIDKILNPKWANKKPDLMTVTQEMIAAINRVKNDLGIIRAMALPFEQQIIDAYLRTLNMSEALAEKKRMEEQAERLKALEAERKAVAPLPAPAPAPVEPPPPAAMTQSAVIPLDNAPISEATKTIDVRFYGTTEAFRREMKALTQKYGIRYSAVPSDNEGRIIPWQQSKTA